MTWLNSTDKFSSDKLKSHDLFESYFQKCYKSREHFSNSVLNMNGLRSKGILSPCEPGCSGEIQDGDDEGDDEGSDDDDKINNINPVVEKNRYPGKRKE